MSFKVILRLIHIVLTLIRTRIYRFSLCPYRDRLLEATRLALPPVSFPKDIAPPLYTHTETASPKLRVLRSPRSLFDSPQHVTMQLQRSLAHVIAQSSGPSVMFSVIHFFFDHGHP